MLPDLARVIEQVGREKGIDKKVIIEALENAIETAARKKYSPESDFEAHYDENTGEIELFQFKQVVKKVSDPDLEISTKEAHDLDPEAEVGDSLGVKLDASDFGRIAAQAAKQIIIQRVKEAEHSVIYGDYVNRKGEVITGVARRVERGAVVVDLGRAEARLPFREMLPGEQYRTNDRVQAYILDVLSTQYGPQIILSRAATEYLVRLFEMEVPEIEDGIVSIKTAVREPGARAKIAVTSTDSKVDPVGACVGMRGSRVQSIVNELRGERIDIVPWSPDPTTFVCSALAPAKISSVIINEEDKTMGVIVPDDQLSLAIGKRGQNVRLASQLTEWHLDILSEAEVADRKKIAMAELRRIEGVGETVSLSLYQSGYLTVDDVLNADLERLAKVPAVGEEKASELIAAAANPKPLEEIEIPEEEEVLEEKVEASEKEEIETSKREELPEEETSEEVSAPEKMAVKEELSPEPCSSDAKGIEDIPGVGGKTAEKLNTGGFDTPEKLLNASPEEIAEKTSLSVTQVSKIVESARNLIEVDHE